MKSFCCCETSANPNTKKRRTQQSSRRQNVVVLCVRSEQYLEKREKKKPDIRASAFSLFCFSPNDRVCKIHMCVKRTKKYNQSKEGMPVKPADTRKSLRGQTLKHYPNSEMLWPFFVDGVVVAHKKMLVTNPLRTQMHTLRFDRKIKGRSMCTHASQWYASELCAC